MELGTAAQKAQERDTLQKRAGRLKKVLAVCVEHQAEWSGSEACNHAVPRLRNLLSLLQRMMGGTQPSPAQRSAVNLARQALLDRVCNLCAVLRELAADQPVLHIRTAHLPSRYRPAPEAGKEMGYAMELMDLLTEHARALTAYGLKTAQREELRTRMVKLEKSMAGFSMHDPNVLLELERTLDGCERVITTELDAAVRCLAGAEGFRKAYAGATSYLR